MSTSGAVAGLGAQYRLTTIGPADVLTLHSVPVELVPAPGAGKVIVPVWATGEWEAGVDGVSEPIRPTIQWESSGLGWTALQTLQDENSAPVSTLATATKESVFATRVGVDGLAMQIKIGDNPDPLGAIVTSSVFDGGADYVAHDTGTIDGNVYGSPATYEVLTVDGLGAVLTYTVTLAGEGYAEGQVSDTTPDGGQPGIGTGFKVTVDTVPPFDGTLYVTLYYNIYTLH